MGPPASHWISRAPWYSGYSLLFLLFVYRILTFCDWPSQTIRLSIHYVMRVLQPQVRRPGLDCSLFARRYWGNRGFFLFLRVLRCFSSPGSLCMAMYSPCSDRGLLCRVSPFRNRRVNGYLLLTAAYRSLSRLSSALSAKASTLRSLYLDLLILASLSI